MNYEVFWPSTGEVTDHIKEKFSGEVIGYEHGQFEPVIIEGSGFRAVLQSEIGDHTCEYKDSLERILMELTVMGSGKYVYANDLEGFVGIIAPGLIESAPSIKDEFFKECIFEGPYKIEFVDGRLQFKLETGYKYSKGKFCAILDTHIPSLVAIDAQLTEAYNNKMHSLLDHYGMERVDIPQKLETFSQDKYRLKKGIL